MSFRLFRDTIHHTPKWDLQVCMWCVITCLSGKDLDTGQNNITVCAVVHRSSIESFYLKN